MNYTLLLVCVGFPAPVLPEKNETKTFHHVQVLQDGNQLVVASFAMRQKPIGGSESGGVLDAIHLLAISPNGVQMVNYIGTKIPFRSGEWIWERQGAVLTISQYDGEKELWTGRLDPLTGVQEESRKSKPALDKLLRSHLKAPRTYGHMYPNAVNIVAKHDSRLNVEIRFATRTGGPISRETPVVAQITTSADSDQARVFVIQASGEIVQQR
jgi:hypothetical protein